MAPPIIITEDTPPDMLAGSMDLTVVLPDGHSLKMSVERSMPMMDLLVQVTTANKISPAGHVIRPLNERGTLPYKPSTPIGALDAWTIHVVPKQHAQCTSIKKSIKMLSNQPFEQTFRLQVHLPRNQLYVARVSPKTRLADILLQVCSEKNLDPIKYSLRAPNNLDQVLNLSCTLADYKLQEVSLVCNRTHPVEVSSVDIMSLQREPTNPAYRNTMCEGSVSSGSMEGRSLSPAPSDESSASPPPLPPSRPTRKRRPAPKPPITNQNVVTKEEKQQNGIQASTVTVIHHSRNSSDSSGYHEASVLSESPQSHSVTDSLNRRKMASVSEHLPGAGESLSQSLTDVAAIQPPLKQATSYNSISSISSGGRKKKNAPPPPPVVKNKISSEEQQRTPSVSSTASSTTTLDGNEGSAAVKSATLPPSSRLNSEPPTLPPSPTPHPSVDVDVEPPVTLQGRFAASASRLIRKTKRKVGRNLNKFGNSFKFKKPQETHVDSDVDIVNQNCNKLVRKNAIKKNNVDYSTSDEKPTNVDDIGVKSRSFSLHSKSKNINVERKKNMISELGLVKSNFMGLNKMAGVSRKDSKFNFNNESSETKNFQNVNTLNSSLNDEVIHMDETSSIIKYNEFFRRLEHDNINRNVVAKSTSFTDKTNTIKSLPQKYLSFRALPESSEGELVYKDNKTLEGLKLKLTNLEACHSSLNDLQINTNKFTTSGNSLPVKCNLLAPPPANLIVNRQESLQSWNRFLHQLDDILLAKEGVFV